jgi:hypothetical protein
LFWHSSINKPTRLVTGLKYIQFLLCLPGFFLIYNRFKIYTIFTMSTWFFFNLAKLNLQFTRLYRLGSVTYYAQYVIPVLRHVQYQRRLQPHLNIFKPEFLISYVFSLMFRFKSIARILIPSHLY